MMLTEQDVRKYLEPDEKFLAGFFSRKMGYFYVPDSYPKVQEEGILVLTSHRVLILQKYKGGGVLGGDAREEVYSIPLSNVNAVEMTIFEGRQSAWLTLVMAAGYCCRLSVHGSDIDKAQHLLARVMMSEKTRQFGDDGAMTSIRFYEQQAAAWSDSEKEDKK